ncbi:cation diffusion facilitator family transporter [Enterococcus columbae]|uniref:Uncharacterized protein n=1 Tax=Enterococcus columbae DSM 7374 = ATCC 51263 TaxID=1121865 RepID=S0KWL5_9ENTE|nr:cation diffusion facilitator family transporter [Enterococcus columbae]EOT44508.1 hypothetical protein OMW_00564 [Enterococcus columbae DSM 7374 = ATCC 51263]EOW84666.1 hypothetical protein I568_01162 [Enterococcus columbae DSM 7374 = ATCC 51263]OJG23553.1 hypothetical protein RR47_GL000530 [Enterococcus columbae DSM 7374 = ATCC 51263]
MFSNDQFHDERSQIGSLAGLLGLVSNLILFVAKLFIGLLSHSVSIMADAMNSLADTASSILTLLGFKIASKPADQEHPYGHERFEYVSGLIVSLMIIFVGFKFLESSFQRILHPESIQISPIIFIILVLSILIKIFQAKMYRYFGKKIQSNTLIATGQDSLNDVLTTFIVLLSAGIEQVTGWRVDGYFGFGLAIYILFSGYQLLKEFMDILLGMRPKQEELKKIAQIFGRFKDIVGYHDLLVHSYGPKNRFASVHIEIDETWTLNQAHDVIDEIERTFKEEMGLEMVCHLDPVPLYDQTHEQLRSFIKNELKTIDDRLKMHDLRFEAEKIAFDVVIPKNFPYTDEFLAQVLQQKIMEKYSIDEIEIIFDHNYLL